MGQPGQFHKKDLKRCFKLYTALDLIEKSSDLNNINNAINKFKRKCDKILNRRIFFSDDVLTGTFEDGNQTLVNDNKVLPRVSVNGETVLYRVLSKYQGEREKKRLLPSDSVDRALTGRCGPSTMHAHEAFMNKDEARKQIIYYLIENIPTMIVTSKQFNVECEGYSPLYMAIVKKHDDVLKMMIDKIKKYNSEENPNKLEVGPVIKSILDGDSVMLAGTPLGVAALTLDLPIFKLVQRLYDTHDDIQGLTTNLKEDNIIHSMIKYFTKHQNEIEKRAMLTYILDPHSWKNTNKAKEGIQKLLRSKSMEHLTPLQLAAKRQQFDFFEMIIQCKSYCDSTSDDGLSMEEVYDITEMDTIPVEEENVKGNEYDHIQKIKHFSVLEFVYLQQMQIAFLFASYRPVYMIIKEKWSRYRYYFYTWFVLHLIAMSLLSWAAVQRSSLQFQFDNVSGMNTIRNTHPVRDDPTSLGLSIFGLIFGVVVIVCHSMMRYLVYWCCYKRFGARIKAKFVQNLWRMISSLPYTNHMFELFFVLCALFLIMDFPLAYTVNEYENQCLVFAVIIGWYLVLFFLQVFRRFSFFTVLIQRVLRDMFNFAIVMGFLLLGFTVAMFVVMQGANTTNDDFTSVPKTLLKMFTVMLGIGEFNDMFNARQPVMAIFVFVLFVLLTTILLLNALIAMMSNSCTELMSADYGIVKANKMHETLQKLSVIIFFESILPKCMCHSAGYISDKYRREIKVKTTQKVNSDEDTSHNTFASQVVQTMTNLLTKRRHKKAHRTPVAITPIERKAELNITHWEQTSLPTTCNEEIEIKKSEQTHVKHI